MVRGEIVFPSEKLMIIVVEIRILFDKNVEEIFVMRLFKIFFSSMPLDC